MGTGIVAVIPIERLLPKAIKNPLANSVKFGNG
jgi:hypothetical protein